MSDHPIIQALLDQLALNATARERVERERAFLEKSLLDAKTLFSANGSTPPRPPSATAPSMPSTPTSPFAAKPGGPKDTLLRLIDRDPGITPVSARRLARLSVETDAKDPARSIEEALRRMIDDKVVELRNGGLYKVAGA